MSISIISSSHPLPPSVPRTPINLQQFQQEFQQLGSDLQGGNISAANQDFTALQQLNNSISSTSSGPIAQTFKQLGQDLKSGNLSAADQDYAQLHQDFQQTDPTHNNLRHHLQGWGDGLKFEQSGQAPASGDVASAQAAYNSALLGLRQFGSSSDPSLIPQLTESSANGISVNA